MSIGSVFGPKQSWVEYMLERQRNDAAMNQNREFRVQACNQQYNASSVDEVAKEKDDLLEQQAKLLQEQNLEIEHLRAAIRSFPLHSDLVAHIKERTYRLENYKKGIF